MNGPGKDGAGAAFLQRAAAQIERSGKPYFLLCGMGGGRLLAGLTDSDPAHGGNAFVIACEPDPEAARRTLADWPRLARRAREGRVAVLTDSSPWAILLLLLGAGLRPDNTATLCNPEERSKARIAQCRRIQRLFTASALTREPLAVAGEADISFAMISRPDEPGVEELLAGLPAYFREAVVLWDAKKPPGRDMQCPAPLIQAARPLGGDFAAQRNHALSLCSGEWIFSLDGDERCDPETWRALPALAARADVGGWYFPRHTFYPDERHVLAGFGLWPDLQLRLFRRGPDTLYVRRVHERLAGLPGPEGIVVNHPIGHYNRIMRDDDAVREKLELFTAASGGKARHALSKDYPCLGQDVFTLPMDELFLVFPPTRR